MKLPVEYIESLKQALIPQQIAGRYTQLKQSGKGFTGKCPFHEEKTPSFWVYPDGGYKCFGCGASGGDLIQLVMEQEKKPFMDVIKDLAEESGTPMPATRSDNNGVDNALWSALQDAVSWYVGGHQYFKDARRYLSARGIGDEAIQKHRLGYASKRANNLDPLVKRHGIEVYKALGLIRDGDGGGTYALFRHRLIIPVLNRAGSAIALVGRALDPDAKAKYITLNTPFFKRSEGVYGEHMVEGGPVVLTEGPLDAIAAQQYLKVDARAPLGTEVSTQQIARILADRNNLEVIPDSDEAGSRAAMQLARVIAGQLERPVRVRFWALPEGEDPASYLTAGHGMSSLPSLELDEALAFSAQTLFDLDSWVGQAQAAQWLADCLPPSPAGPVIEVLRARYAKAIGVPLSAVTKKVDD